MSIKIIHINILYPFLTLKSINLLFDGKKLDIKLNPSSGKIGKRLNTIKKALISIISAKNNVKKLTSELMFPTTL